MAVRLLSGQSDPVSRTGACDASLRSAAMLSATKAVVPIGQSTTLEWHAPGATGVYLTFVGQVSPTGSRQVTPANSMVYAILAEGCFGVVARHVTVETQGSRAGGDLLTDPLFEYPVQLGPIGGSVTHFQEQTLRILQDRMHFSVTRNLVDESRSILITNLSERSELVGSAEPRLRARRIAYRVEIRYAGIPARITCEIRTYLQSARRLESTWLTERNPDLQVQEALKVKAFLAHAAGVR